MIPILTPLKYNYVFIFEKRSISVKFFFLRENNLRHKAAPHSNHVVTGTEVVTFSRIPLDVQVI